MDSSNFLTKIIDSVIILDWKAPYSSQSYQHMENLENYQRLDQMWQLKLLLWMITRI